MTRNAIVLTILLCCLPAGSFAQQSVPPYDLWTGDILAHIHDRTTLDYTVAQYSNSFGIVTYDVFFTSNPSASFFDAKAPYAEHNGEKIRIHAYLSVPAAAGPFPALVIGHGHGGPADPAFAQQVALFGFVALYIDGPRAGQSTGGPQDDIQAWISIDKGPQR